MFFDVTMAKSCRDGHRFEQFASFCIPFVIWLDFVLDRIYSLLIFFFLFFCLTTSYDVTIDISPSKVYGNLNMFIVNCDIISRHNVGHLEIPQKGCKIGEDIEINFHKKI